MQKNKAISNQLQKVLNSIKKNNFSLDLIPEEYQYNNLVVSKERKLNLRKIDEVGFDVIKNEFYVYETIYEDDYPNSIITTFEAFDDFYNFVGGNIYINNCFYQYSFDEDAIKKYKIDLKKINFEYIIQEDTVDEKDSAKEVKEEIKTLKRHLDKLINAKSYSEFKKGFRSIANNDSYYWSEHYIFLFNSLIGKKNKKYFDYFINLINERSIVYENECINLLCYYFGADEVVEKLEFYNMKNKSSTDSRRKKKVNDFIKPLKDNKLKSKKKKRYDSIINLFVIGETLYDPNNDLSHNRVQINNYYYSFDEFVKFLNSDLSDCDLYEFENNKGIDFSKYKTNKNTTLPKNLCLDKREVKKYYLNNIFHVDYITKDKKGNEIDWNRNKFKLFSEYVSFLNNDLSNGDYLMCDGLQNLKDISDINFNKCILPPSFRSRVFKNDDSIKFDIKINKQYNPLDFNTDYAVLKERDIEIINDRDWTSKEFYYVSDIHLEHQILNAKCKTNTEVEYLLRKIALSLCESTEYSGIPIICGDIASTFELYKEFIKQLKFVFNDRTIIFVLGNHELWEHSGLSVDEIVDKYRKILPKNFILLQNSLYICNDNGHKYLSENDLETMSDEEIKQSLRDSRCTIFGGIGFSGLNEEFNAKNGIYRNTINRTQEKKESNRISSIFKKIDKLVNKNFVVITHMPVTDWYKDEYETNERVFISGHNHRNYYYNDGSYAIYADNQIGYNNTNIVFKYFKLDGKYDWFSEYSDGIFEINRNDYINFYRGINKAVTFNREFKKLNMIKREGYYCFIIENNNGNLMLLDGGSIRKLSKKNLDYYYDHLLEQIYIVEKPFMSYHEKQKEISNIIKKIGGSGRIHGCIIDIDFFNHIYFNPDGTITPYCALNMIYKFVVPDITKLLENNCPELYRNYCKLIEQDKKYSLANINNNMNTDGEFYLDTDIYKMSRLFNKLQKLDDKLLTIWVDKELNEIESNIKLIGQ